jgi:hypothetical protein
LMPSGFTQCLIPNVHPFCGTALSLTTVSLTPCRNGTAAQPSPGSGQLLPGPTIALGQFFWLTAVSYG